MWAGAIAGAEMFNHFNLNPLDMRPPSWAAISTPGQNPVGLKTKIYKEKKRYFSLLVAEV